MDQLEQFFVDNFPPDTKFMFPQFERTEKLEFEYVPDNIAEFTAVVEKAPWEILRGFGFRKWDTLSNVIKENLGKEKKNVISIPIINAPGETYDVDCGRGDAPTEAPTQDMNIILFPGEWYGIIPDGFIVTGLYGEQYPFKNGKSDDDIRFGCLPYGILRPV